ncbi:MAG: hypothetical protein IKY17_05405 [Oscillospiraceae bacterium]|nr:hypothetical protein [Oscillospiraceae bacterium]
MERRVSKSTILICILIVVVLILSVCLVKAIRYDPAAACYLEATVDLKLDYDVFVRKYGSVIPEDEYNEIQSFTHMETTDVNHCYIRQLEDGTIVVFILSSTVNNAGDYELIGIKVIRN